MGKSPWTLLSDSSSQEHPKIKNYPKTSILQLLPKSQRRRRARRRGWCSSCSPAPSPGWCSRQCRICRPRPTHAWGWRSEMWSTRSLSRWSNHQRSPWWRKWRPFVALSLSHSSCSYNLSMRVGICVKKQRAFIKTHDLFREPWRACRGSRPECRLRWVSHPPSGSALAAAARPGSRSRATSAVPSGPSEPVLWLWWGR